MILRNLPFESLNRLRLSGVLHIHDPQGRFWRIKHIPHKMFYAYCRDIQASVTLWDTWGYQRTSFLRLIEEWKLATDAEHELIARMKGQRDIFDCSRIIEIQKYCQIECQLLARWMEQVDKLHKQCGLQPRAWCGSGATGSALLRKWQWTPVSVLGVSDDSVLRAAQESYYGGRSEISCLGVIRGNLCAYDIQSAYPHALSQMPHVIRWREYRNRPEPGCFGYAHIRWRISESNTWNPFPCPIGNENHHYLYYPPEGEGWYCLSEIDAIIDIIGSDAIQWLRSYVADVSGYEFPHISETAKLRLKYKSEKDPRHYVLKYGLNSLYGKLAQKCGNARYACLIYASQVTAMTRARVTRMAMSYPKSVIAIATDGILSRNPLPIEEGNQLGDWEYKSLGNQLFLAQSGLYWTPEILRTRGYHAGSLDRSLREVIEQTWIESLQKRPWKPPSVEVSARQFIGYRTATHRQSPELLCRWNISHKKIYLSPYPKRKPHRIIDGRMETRPVSSDAGLRLRCIIESILECHNEIDETPQD
jgi:hypothetical protein